MPSGSASSPRRRRPRDHRRVGAGRSAGAAGNAIGAGGSEQVGRPVVASATTRRSAAIGRRRARNDGGCCGGRRCGAEPIDAAAAVTAAAADHASSPVGVSVSADGVRPRRAGRGPRAASAELGSTASGLPVAAVDAPLHRPGPPPTPTVAVAVAAVPVSIRGRSPPNRRRRGRARRLSGSTAAPARVRWALTASSVGKGHPRRGRPRVHRRPRSTGRRRRPRASRPGDGHSVAR